PPKKNAVLFDDRDGAEQAVEHLIRLGHRDIWFVRHTAWPWNRRRHDAYVKIMKRQGFKSRAIVEGLAQAGHELGLQAGRRILEGDKPCTAVFAGSDYIASGFIDATCRAGRRVPTELSLT